MPIFMIKIWVATIFKVGLPALLVGFLASVFFAWAAAFFIEFTDSLTATAKPSPYSLIKGLFFLTGLGISVASAFMVTKIHVQRAVRKNKRKN